MLFALILFALIFTLFGIAFPPLLVGAAIFWGWLIARIRQNLGVERRKEELERRKAYDKVAREIERQRTKALRYFSS